MHLLLMPSIEIPTVALPEDAGTVRVIAGEFSGQNGAAKTLSPINVWDVNEHVQALIRSCRALDPATLTDADTPLESLIPEEEPKNAA